jgi:hypothetical protein
MKTYKILDAWISAGLIISFIIINIIDRPGSIIDENILIGYFVVGGWQVTSMIVHAVTRTFTYRPGIRYAYHWVTFIAVITMPAGSFYILVITAPFMAVLYTWLCFDEVYVKMQRPLAGLK